MSDETRVCVVEGCTATELPYRHRLGLFFVCEAHAAPLMKGAHPWPLARIEAPVGFSKRDDSDGQLSAFMAETTDNHTPGGV